MLLYFTKRCLIAVPTLFGITVVCFFLVQLTPGGPVEQTLAEWRQSSAMGETGSGNTSRVTDEQREMLVRYYGFDKPIHVRYFRWLAQLVHLDFGESYFYGEPVGRVIARALPVSLSLGLFSFLLTYGLCIPLGLWKAVHHRSLGDTLTSAAVFLLYSVPAFALAIMLIVLFGGGSLWRFFPIGGLVSDNFADLSPFEKLLDYLHHLFLPLVCYTAGSFASLTMVVKNSLLEQLQQNYILTARAKGLPEKIVIRRHALRNALLPIASGLGHWLSAFFTGSLLIETIFGLQGVGRLSFESIVHRDYPVVLANILILSVLTIAGNLLSDLLYVWIDPRIDFT